MSDSDTTSTAADLEALKALQADASELERIEGLLDQFNVFEAIGFVNQEVKHSRFLAFLLDPKQNHDLGDLFLKMLLREVLTSAPEVPLPSNFQNLDASDLSETVVQTERHNIDILLTSETHGFAVIIENKVWTTEHSDQLSRYFHSVKRNYPDWHVLGIYLTPIGTLASRRDRYLSLSYGVVCEIVDDILEVRGSTFDPKVRMAIEDYVKMVRRHIVDDPEIAEMCRDMYHRHRRAFDLIYKYRPDPRSEISSVLKTLVQEELGLASDEHTKNRVRFVVQEWDTHALRKGRGWTSSKRILLFEFWNERNSLDLRLMIGPGDSEIRQKLLNMARANPGKFRIPNKPDFKHGAIYIRPFLQKEMYQADVTNVEREQEIRKRWNEFIDKDLPRIEEALKKETWIWE